MDLTPEEYQKFAAARAGRSPVGKDTALAFLIGGAICAAGQGITALWAAAGLGEREAAAAASCTLIALSALLTGLNLYNKLARFGGAGTLVPITGFANAVAAPAIDARAEGVITGMAVKMFTVAGPVLTCGVCAASVYGLVLWLLG